MTTDLDFCITEMQSSLALGRKALQTEIAVGLYVFHAHGETDTAAKKALRAVYASAGEMDCLTLEGASYKTVSRRINRVAMLFVKLGRTKVKKAIGAARETSALEALREMIEPLALTSMDALADYVGVEVRRMASEVNHAPSRRATDRPEVVHIATAHLDVAISPEIPPSEIVDLIDALKRFLDQSRIKEESN